MADVYYITGIRLDKNEEHIEFVRVRKETSSENFVVHRQFVAQLIQSGVNFKSRYPVGGKEWRTGESIDVYEKIYLRANPNETAKDNLRNLPKF